MTDPKSAVAILNKWRNGTMVQQYKGITAAKAIKALEVREIRKS